MVPAAILTRGIPIFSSANMQTLILTPMAAQPDIQTWLPEAAWAGTSLWPQVVCLATHNRLLFTFESQVHALFIMLRLLHFASLPIGTPHTYSQLVYLWVTSSVLCGMVASGCTVLCARGQVCGLHGGPQVSVFSSSLAALPGFDLIFMISRHKPALATKPGIELG